MTTKEQVKAARRLHLRSEEDINTLIKGFIATQDNVPNEYPISFVTNRNAADMVLHNFKNYLDELRDAKNAKELEILEIQKATEFLERKGFSVTCLNRRNKERP